MICERVALARYEHLASAAFWTAYDRLPEAVRKLADRNFALLKQDPSHPSLHFKKVGGYRSVRVGIHYRALAVETGIFCSSGSDRTQTMIPLSAEKA